MKTEERLNKSRLASHISDRSILSKKQVLAIMDTFAALAFKHAKDTFTIPGIGKLMVVNRAARKGHNFKTGGEVALPARRVVKFRVSKTAKNAILGKAKGRK